MGIISKAMSNAWVHISIQILLLGFFLQQAAFAQKWILAERRFTKEAENGCFGIFSEVMYNIRVHFDGHIYTRDIHLVIKVDHNVLSWHF